MYLQMVCAPNTHILHIMHTHARRLVGYVLRQIHVLVAGALSVNRRRFLELVEGDCTSAPHPDPHSLVTPSVILSVAYSEKKIREKINRIVLAHFTDIITIHTPYQLSCCLCGCIRASIRCVTTPVL